MNSLAFSLTNAAIFKAVSYAWLSVEVKENDTDYDLDRRFERKFNCKIVLARGREHQIIFNSAEDYFKFILEWS